jgi:hypothetical protein
LDQIARTGPRYKGSGQNACAGYALPRLAHDNHAIGRSAASPTAISPELPGAMRHPPRARSPVGQRLVERAEIGRRRVVLEDAPLARPRHEALGELGQEAVLEHHRLAHRADDELAPRPLGELTMPSATSSES